MSAYLVLRRVRIHNANAMGSPYIAGFPPMTAWCGGAHALERRIRAHLPEISFNGVGVSCHKFEMQSYRGVGDNVRSLKGMGSPFVYKKGKFTKPSFIEEARCHLTVTLIIKLNGVDEDNKDEVERLAATEFPLMKMASGDILGYRKPKVMLVDDKDEKKHQQGERQLLRMLMPGFVIRERRDILLNTQKEMQDTDALNALLATIAIYHQKQDNFSMEKAYPGWLVPLSVGYRRISTPRPNGGRQDERYLHCFVENVCTLGEFKMPFRFKTVDATLWHYEYIEKDGLYICRNQAV